MRNSGGRTNFNNAAIHKHRDTETQFRGEGEITQTHIRTRRRIDDTQTHESELRKTPTEHRRFGMNTQ